MKDRGEKLNKKLEEKSQAEIVGSKGQERKKDTEDQDTEEESKRQEQEARPGHGRMGVAHISELVSCSSRLPETEPIRPERREAK